MVTADVALQFERLAVRGDHRDLRLRIGSYRHSCDSYYLAIDESPTAARSLGANLARLLEQWSTQVDALKGTGGTAYLPYDFSDQCTAWLRVSSVDGRTAEVQAGWSSIEGWGIEPSNYVATAPEVTDFAPISNARIECALTDLTACFGSNRDALAASGQ
ncbi:hypothetical protein [Streptomyces sp. V4I23]|uniref:hypothetical protein n=1 Tax=Streptomyces sp. V4I23 TaxID=3042282 RepID=UPI0027D8C4A1|nr:hypothetical protein [Streptomyces sp. V4I23]